jgi:hypothetical protein
MKIEDKIQRMVSEANEPWSQKFGIHSTTFETFLETLQSDVLEFELEMRRRGKEPDLTKFRRLIGQLGKANKEMRRILVTAAKGMGI